MRTFPGWYLAQHVTDAPVHSMVRLDSTGLLPTTWQPKKLSCAMQELHPLSHRAVLWRGAHHLLHV